MNAQQECSIYVTVILQNTAIIAAALFMIIITVGCNISIGDPKYEVVSNADSFEIRDYAPYVVAETIVDGTLEDAGNRAFQILFNYISGKNHSHAKIAMIAPVSQKPTFEKIKMTSPVSQQLVEGRLGGFLHYAGIAIH